MNKLIFLFLLCISYPGLAGNDNDQITPGDGETSTKIVFVKKIPATEIKDQYRTSTCWSFSGISMLESELMRLDKGEYNLSEMYIVRQNYEKKAERYVRMHGKANFAPGGEVNDVTDVFSEFGIVPEEIYTGLKPDQENHKHEEMDRLLNNYVETLVSESTKELSPVWKEGFSKVLDSYLGEVPMEFDFNGITYSPKSFASDLGIEPENYIMITSFMHEPYYKPVILEIPDNWSWAESYNVPLDMMDEIVDSAIMKGYSVCWAADVSEEGFNFKEGFALAPEIAYSEDSRKESRKWNKKTESEKKEEIFSLSNPVKELEVSPEIRQNAFDNRSTTDDHGMHIVGIARDRNDRYFYYVKNSWGIDNPYNGYLFVSKPYFRFKTISIMVNKEAIPAPILKKLDL
ncbi:MAG: aminopeptidase [Bacteroidales bacterium]|nr:aminopeptidase [Bacteroidales bacterium]